MTYTICERNTALQSGGWHGTYDTLEAAQARIEAQLPRLRSFVELFVCEGTPKSPGKKVGPVMRGAT